MERKASFISKLYGRAALHHDKNNKPYAMGAWVCGLLYFENDIGIGLVEKIATEDLLSIPKFRSRFDPVKGSYFELEKSEIDMSYHLVQIDDVLDIKTLRDDYIGDPFKNFDFDETKPLWRLLYFPKIEDGRSLLVTQLCHSLGDGIAQMEVLYRILDSEEDARPPQKRKKAPSTYGPLNRSKIFVGGVFNAIAGIFGGHDSPNPLRRPNGKIVNRMLTDTTAKIPLDKFKELKKKYPGATVNDIMVMVLNLCVMEAFKEYEEETGETVLKKIKRIQGGFAINMRKPGQSGFRDGSPNNDVAQGLFTFYTKYKSRTELAWKVKLQNDRIKISPSPIIQQKIIKGIMPLLPKKTVLQTFLDFTQVSTSLLSNVAGPKTMASIRGQKVQDMEFCGYGPVNSYFGLLSYNGQVSCSILLEESVPLKPEQLTKHWTSEFNKLYEESMAYDGAVPMPGSCLRKL